MGANPTLCNREKNRVYIQFLRSIYSAITEYILRKKPYLKAFLAMALQFRIREQKTAYQRRQEKGLLLRSDSFGSKGNFCEELADGSTVDVSDVKAVVNRLAIVISRDMKRSCAVDCGDLGIFRPSVRSKSVEKKEDFDVNLMKHPAVIFTPKPNFKNSLIGSSFRAVSNKFIAETEDEEEYKPNGHTGL